MLDKTESNSHKVRDVNDTEHHTLNVHQKRLLRTDQANEFTKINKYSEGLCYGCRKNDLVSAMIVDMCYACIGKRGNWHDAGLLTLIIEKPECHCFICGEYRLGGAHLNARFCLNCSKKIAKKVKEWNKGGGMFANPFYKYLKKQQGNDWRWLTLNHKTSFRK